MIIVIQCAAWKHDDTGYLQSEGKRVVFVAKPELAPPRPDLVYARPDDPSDSSRSWREVLAEYNSSGRNPLELYEAYRLYIRDTYVRLVDKFGVGNVFILSAGWGLLKADFLTPNYDITFSPQADGYKRRSTSDAYKDFNMLPANSDEPIVFFGGKDYIALFSSLTSSITCQKTVFYNSPYPPRADGCTLKRFPTRTRTNWHYEAANAFIAGRITL